MFLKPYSFWKHAVTVSLKKPFSNTLFRWYTFGKFYLVKFSYFSGRPNKMKERFWNIFDWPLCGWYIKYKYCWYVLKNLYISNTHPILWGSVHTGCYIYNSLVYVINVFFFFFAIQKVLQILWKMFLIQSLYVLQKPSPSPKNLKANVL